MYEVRGQKSDIRLPASKYNIENKNENPAIHTVFCRSALSADSL
jgi:hypothetical protein